MAETSGTVANVKVNGLAQNGADFALVTINDASAPGVTEVFFVWFTAAERFVPTGPQWLQRAMQVSLLREALTSGKNVTIFHDDASSFINSVQLNA